jgi:tetratricopeptide (TPR) repeat protein
MSKQRRPASKPVAKKKPVNHARRQTKTARKPVRASAARTDSRRRTTQAPRKKAASRPTARRVADRPRPKGRPAPVSAVVPSHEHAIRLFERGFRALQQRQFDRAAAALMEVVNGFPDEKEMQERARVYLSVCERQANAAGTKPRSFEDRRNAATVAINRGAHDEALRLLRNLESENPGDDYVQYLMTVALTAAGAVDQALAHLRRAIELNPENRFLSAADADLETLRRHASFLAAVAAPAPAPGRRTGARKR